MKKTMTLILVSMLLLLSLAACQSASGNDSPTNEPAGQNPPTSPSVSSEPNQSDGGPITVISREEGSGTRSAFVELFGVRNADKVDQTTDYAEITNSTSVMMTSVAGDPNAIGYISLGSLNNTVKAASIDGAEATVDNINNGSYTISRPFIIATKADIGDLAQDFIDFILSSAGQDIIEANGYIRVPDTGAYTGAKPSGKITVGGSSSVSPVMEKLIEAYKAINSGADIELQTSDSGSGMSNTIEGVFDIGMSSRELKDSEHDGGLQDITIAMDGIAVIVNTGNPVDSLTKEQVRQIFAGEIANWSEVG